MKVIKVFTNNLRGNRTALMTDASYTPYVIVSGYNPKMPEGQQWNSAYRYYNDFINFAKDVMNLTETYISYDRMSEIASMTIDGLIENEPGEAEDYLRYEVELTPEEAMYFGVENLTDNAEQFWEDSERE